MESASSTQSDEMRGDSAAALPALRIEYRRDDPAALLAQSDVLVAIGFGVGASAHPRYLNVGLKPLLEPAPLEVWRGRAGVRHGSDGVVRWSSDGDYTFAAIELDEAECGGITTAAHKAYAALQAWRGAAPHRHVLRIWNYFDAINAGAGDEERYRQFCVGRATGMNGAGLNGATQGFPAATAIGRSDGRRVLQLYWLAARVPGVALENPRQMSAWRYPRRYGPKAPNFARAMRAPSGTGQIYISGTAAIVGHTSHHADDCMAQLDETLNNIDSLLANAGGGRFGPCCVLKAYVRHDQDAERVRERVRERLGARTPLLLLQGDVCRAELLIEIDGVHCA